MLLSGWTDGFLDGCIHSWTQRKLYMDDECKINLCIMLAILYQLCKSRVTAFDFAEEKVWG